MAEMDTKGLTTIAMTAGKWLLARLEEPSTFAGGGMVASALVGIFGPDQGMNIAHALLLVGGIVAIWMPEKK